MTLALANAQKSIAPERAPENFTAREHIEELNALLLGSYGQGRLCDIAQHYSGSCDPGFATIDDIRDLQKAFASAVARFGLEDDPTVIAACDYLATRYDPTGW